MTRKVFLLCGALPVLTFAAGSSQQALAQSAAAHDTDQLAEIVVTATKRSESLQDVPVAITALSGDAIENIFPGQGVLAQPIADWRGA